jgi:hypothetical protein
MIGMFVCILSCEGCKGGHDLIAPEVPPPISTDVLLAAPDTLTLHGNEIRVEPYLWRDFMPPSPSDGKPLIAAVTLSQSSEPNFPKTVTAADVWVISGNDTWKEVMQDEQPHYPPSEVVWIARNGPKWGPGIQVDVVVGLMIENRGLQLVRVPNVDIIRTD